MTLLKKKTSWINRVWIVAILANVLLSFTGAHAVVERQSDGMIYQPGSEYFFYKGKWSPGIQLENLKPVYQRVIINSKPAVNLKDDPNVPKGDYFVVCRGYLRMTKPFTTTQLMPGYGDSTYNVMTIGGKEVHRKEPGDKASTFNQIFLKAGYHPYQVVWLKNKNYFLKIYGDPGSGQNVWHKAPFKQSMQLELLSAFAALHDHITGGKSLTDDQIDWQKEQIKKNRYAIAANETIVKSALKLVSTFESTKGALWRDLPGMSKRRSEPKGLNWAMYHVMQFVLDELYTAENLAKYESLIDGYKFQCSDFFPGKCPSADPKEIHRVKIKASNKKSLRDNRMYLAWPARKPTGTYLAPGAIATVTVPKSIVGKGYMIRVGAHSWDNTYRPNVRRLGRCTTTFNIDSTETKVASPLGGGIYIEVPYLADAADVVEVKIKNAVRSPYFSAKPFHETSLAEWKNKERNFKAPWADFQSEKFMLNVPTNWISKFDDPVTLLKQYDKAMDAVSYAYGFPALQSKEVMYVQIDLQMRSGVFAPGYPSVNSGYNPKKDEGGKSNHHFLRDPRTWPMVELHERCHAFNIMHLLGEKEATVHVPHVAMMNLGFGVDIDEAFAMSRGTTRDIGIKTIDNQAISWMSGIFFSQKKPAQGVTYKHIGHVHWADTARHFGWEPFNKFYGHYNMEHEKGSTRFASDDIFAKLCESSGVDLRPLWHFWGRFNYFDGNNPKSVNAKKLQKFIDDENLPASAKIYDTLVRYQSLVPKNNAEYQKFMKLWWGKQPNIKGYCHQNGHARQWDNTDHSNEKNPPVWPNGDIYNENSCKRVKSYIQEIIDLYFPNGRPKN
jgi:hypothetical protein